jgi:uncharacterized membrane protein
MYRGELGRQVAYRSRLDGSTSWAVTVGGTMTVLSLNNDNSERPAFLPAAARLTSFIVCSLALVPRNHHPVRARLSGLRSQVRMRGVLADISSRAC